jgi:hypothetical protein
MNVFRWNAAKVQQLTPLELWLFIVGRVLAGFGVGVLAMQYWPQVFAHVGLPAALTGVLCIAIALKGFRRRA